MDAGADYICTQLFFDNRDFYDFRERCDLAGIKVPIVAGIMPITSKAGMVRMAELAAGARIPGEAPAGRRPLRRRRRGARGSASTGRPSSAATCCDNNVRGIHFYTLNRSDATRQIYQNLGVESSAALRGVTLFVGQASGLS